MRILVTGGAGYVGSIFIQHLLEQGYNVTCLDRFFFGMEYLESLSHEQDLNLVKDDIRWFNPSILKDTDVVVDLAALSNDPAGELDPGKTYEINYLGRVRVANLSKTYGVKKYILGSSASIYGWQTGLVNEDSVVNPLTTYSKANRMAEVDVLPLNNESFTVTVLRFSSIYGVSPRMRFDLAVNSMVLELFKSGKIIVTGDGKQHRPFLHIKDAARAYQMIIQAPQEKLGGQIFNVGSDDQNYQISDLAKTVGDSVGKEYQIEYRGSHDHRSYIASFKKIKEALHYEARFTVRDGSKEVYRALESGEVTDSIKTRTLEWYKYLQSADTLLREVVLKNTVL